MHTPFLPSLRHQLAPMGSALRTAARRVSQATLHQIEQRLGPALAEGLPARPASGDHSRERIFTLTRTFWCWIWQVLQSNTSCREVVRQVQALFALRAAGRVDEGTAAYCRARKKLTAALLEKALVTSARSAERAAPPRGTLLQGRPLKFVDGSSARVADTPENRAAFPPAQNQHAKPVFPVMRIMALFSALSGALLARATGSGHQSELRLLRELRAALLPGDILGGDRLFGCYAVAAWLQTLQIDLLARLATGRRRTLRPCRRLGPQDALFVWRKPPVPSPLFSREEWKALPAEITVRILRTRVARKGFRTTEVTVVTTLTDAALYPREQILDAYLQRWRLEMCLDDLKTTLGMEMLSCQSPDLLAKELLIFLTAHNLLRWLMARSSQSGAVPLHRLSFKGTLDGLRQWTAAMVQIPAAGRKRREQELWQQLLRTLAADSVPLRPGRQEPRAVKKRPKYPALNKPRRQYIEPLSRNKRRQIANAKRPPHLK
jgi:hypothetical protein